MRSLIFLVALCSSVAFGQSAAQRAKTIKSEAASFTKKCPDLLGELNKCKDADNFKQCVKDNKEKCKKESGDSKNAIKEGGEGIKDLITK